MYSIGRISRSKDLVTIIKTIEELKKNGIIPSEFCKLDIYGEPLTADDKAYLEELKKLVKDLGLEENITFKGTINHSEIHNLT